MGGQPERYGARRAAALLATCLVVLMGGLGCAVIVVTSNSDPTGPLIVAGGCFVGIAFLLWLIRDCHPDNMAAIRWGWLGRKRRKVEYRLAPRPVLSERPISQNCEPTAESVRAIAGGINTWVPAEGAMRPESRRPGNVFHPRRGRAS